MALVDTATLYLKLWDAFIDIAPKNLSALTEEEILQSIRKRGRQNTKQHIREKGYNVVQMYERDWWKKY